MQSSVPINISESGSSRKPKTPANTPPNSPPVLSNSIGICSGSLILTDRIPIKAYNLTGKWVQFRRGDQYLDKVDINALPEIDDEGFTVVKKKGVVKQQTMYYWHMYAHNLYTFEYGKEHGYSLFFCQPDVAVYQTDKIPMYALDEVKFEIVPLIFHAKVISETTNTNTKCKPITFIARNETAIREALEHISYCIVQNREGKYYIVV